MEVKPTLFLDIDGAVRPTVEGAPVQMNIVIGILMVLGALVGLKLVIWLLVDSWTDVPDWIKERKKRKLYGPWELTGQKAGYYLDSKDPYAIYWSVYYAVWDCYQRTHKELGTIEEKTTWVKDLSSTKFIELYGEAKFEEEENKGMTALQRLAKNTGMSSQG